MVSMAEVIDALPVPRSGAAPNRQVVDAVVAFLLVCAQLVLFCATFTFLALMVMGTDSCAYQACGDPAWINRALYVAGFAGAALLVVAAAGTLHRIVRNRVAWFVPLLGCAAQIALGFACAAMEMQAGPLGH
jgi:hypothetical protein